MFAKSDTIHMSAQLLQVTKISRWIMSCGFGRHIWPGINSISFCDVKRAIQTTLQLGIVELLRTGILRTYVFTAILANSYQ